MRIRRTTPGQPDKLASGFTPLSQAHRSRPGVATRREYRAQPAPAPRRSASPPVSRHRAADARRRRGPGRPAPAHANLPPPRPVAARGTPSRAQPDTRRVPADAQKSAARCHAIPAPTMPPSTPSNKPRDPPCEGCEHVPGSTPYRVHRRDGALTILNWKYRTFRRPRRITASA